MRYNRQPAALERRLVLNRQAQPPPATPRCRRRSVPRENRNGLVVHRKLPSFIIAKDGFVIDDLVRRGGSTMRLDVGRARDQRAKYGANPPCDAHFVKGR
jgi:hypothetical protein